MGTVTKHNLYVLTKRRDYLQNKIEEKRNKNMPAGYEESEIEALNKVIALAVEFVNKETTDDENRNKNIDKPPSIEDFAPVKGHPVEKIILKEFIRSPKLKLVISRERRGNREYISFQNYHLNEQQTAWQAAPKASIYLSELNEVISLLTNNQITKDELQLRQEFLSAADICIKRHRYHPTRFLQMLDEHGPVMTAINLVMDPKYHEGFTKLWELKRLDLSVEAIIRRESFKHLFPQEVLDRAEEKLAELDYHQ